MPTASESESSLKRLMRLAPKIRDHKDFETKLTSAPPHLRTIIYEACKPFLKFEAKPLDKYVISAKQMAERERLPTIDERGNLHEFSAIEVGLSQAVATKTLTLVCVKCTREDKYYAVGKETNVDVVIKARLSGWVYDPLSEHETCPKCMNLYSEIGNA